MQLTRLIGLAAAAWIGSVAVGVADPPKVENEDGHLSPVMAEITFLDNTKRKAMVFGVGGDPNKGKGYYPHHFQATSKQGTDVRVWIDTIRAIKAPKETEALVVSKDGTERLLNHKNQGLHLYHPDESKEYVFLAKLKEVHFLKPARKDKMNKAMFDHWLYSPYTGEKLPEQ